MFNFQVIRIIVKVDVLNVCLTHVRCGIFFYLSTEVYGNCVIVYDIVYSLNIISCRDITGAIDGNIIHFIHLYFQLIFE